MQLFEEWVKCWGLWEEGGERWLFLWSVYMSLYYIVDYDDDDDDASSMCTFLYIHMSACNTCNSQQPQKIKTET